MTHVTLNSEQNLYVIPAGSGYSCWGFQNCFDEATQLATLLGIGLPTEGQKVSLWMYDRHRELLNEANQRGLLNRTWFSLNTPAQVQRLLEAYRTTGDRLRLFYGDTATGRDWMNEYDVCGTIGRSMGMLKVPLLMLEKRSGGSAILTDCIIRIIDTATKRELYRHPQYHMKKLEVRPAPQDMVDKGYNFEALADGAVEARFKTHKQAQNWVAFMEGRRMRT